MVYAVVLSRCTVLLRFRQGKLALLQIFLAEVHVAVAVARADIAIYTRTNQIMSDAIATSELETSSPLGRNFSCRFVLSAGAILAITGIAKVWSGLGNSKFLAVIDPIIGIKFGQLMLAVGVAEIVIALVCFFSKRQTLALGLVGWISTSFVVYRLGLWWIDWHRPCSCLGNLTDAIHISPQVADNIMKVLLAYLLIGSYLLLIWQWKSKQLALGAKLPSSTG